MKVVEPFATEVSNANMRKQRMEALLTAWKAWPMWLPGDGASFAPIPPETARLTPEELDTWWHILHQATPVPPRTHADGLKVFVAASGLSVDDLQSHRTIHTVGPRVAIRWLGAATGEAAQLAGYSWALRVQPSAVGIHSDECLRILNKRFRDVRPTSDDAILASEPWPGLDDTIPFLLAEGIASPTSTSLNRLWRIARTLELDECFLDQLPHAARRALADALGDELSDAAAHLDVKTDAELEFFAEGQENIPLDRVVRDLGLPASRLTALLQADGFLDHMHRHIGDHYFDDLAEAFAAVADAVPLGEMLKQLPPGRALFAAVDRMCRRRPELIATYVWHSAFHPEGAFALLQLPQKRPHSPGRTLDLTSEWLEVQKLGRELLALADRSEDWASVFTLGVYDEVQTVARKHFAAAAAILQDVPYESGDLWKRALEVPGRADAILSVLDGYLHQNGRRGDAGLVFALRLLQPLRQGEHQALANKLARAIVDSYASGLELDPRPRAVPAVLCAYGPLLQQLHATLRAGALHDVWQKWLRPFPIASYIERARSDAAERLDSETAHPAFDVPEIIRAHAETLVAQAASLTEFDDVLEAALALFEADRAADLDVSAFSWNALARSVGLRRVVGEPMFVTVGELLARSSDGAELLDRFLSPPAPAHILAYLTLGIGDNELATSITPVLRQSLNDVLSNGLALGHALELANVLHQARHGRDAERFARRVLDIIGRLPPHQRHAYSDAAFAILAGSLAQQELWAELVSFGVDIHGEPQKQFVANMTALGLMNTGRLSEAKVILDRILASSPSNAMALANRVALHVNGREWKEAIFAAEQAKSILPATQWDGVLVNEAAARNALGDAFAAEALLRSISPEGQRRLRVQDRIRHIRSEGSPADVPAPRAPSEVTQVHDVPITSDTVSPPAHEEIDVAIITALLAEYEAVRDRLTGWTPAPPNDEYPNIYAWTIGTIPCSNGSGSYRVVVACAGDSGNLRTLHATTRTIDRWHPRYVLFSGIAGGLRRNGGDMLSHGDVVVSQTIWYYEYQKIVDGQHVPRARDTFAADAGLVSAARAFDSASKAWRVCGVVPPDAEHVPRMVPGMIGSGEKVIDDLEPLFVEAVRNFKPELQAVEMEAAGAAMAIERAHHEGRAVGFMMVRGISDMPKEPEPASPLRAAAAALLCGNLGASLRLLQRNTGIGQRGDGTTTRDNWKPYASAISANFITGLVGSGWWPVGPRQ